MAAKKKEKIKKDSFQDILKDFDAYVEEMRDLEFDAFKENVIQLFKETWQGLTAGMKRSLQQEEIMVDGIAKALHDRDERLTEVFKEIWDEINKVKAFVFCDSLLNQEHRQGALAREDRRNTAEALGVDLDDLREQYSQCMAELRS